MQGSCPVATGDNAAVSRTRCAMTQKAMPNLCFNFVFHHARLDELQQPAESLLSNINRLLHHHYFFFGLNGTKIFHDTRGTLVFMQRITCTHFINETIFSTTHLRSATIILIRIEIDIICQMYPSLQSCINCI